MSDTQFEFVGGIDYAALRRTYRNVDHVQLIFVGPFANIQQSYVVGTMAYLADTTLPTVKLGWKTCAPIAPMPLIYQAAGLTSGPAFEAKDILFFATAASVIRFDSPARVAIPIPINTWMRFHTSCFAIYATQNGGTLDMWIEG